MSEIGDGFFHRLPFADYRKLPGHSITTLKNLMRSPLAYQYWLRHRKDSESMSLGRVAHTAILEPELFEAEYTVWEGAVRRGKEWDAFKAANTGKQIITLSDRDKALAMADSVRDHDAAMRYLSKGEAEVSMIWSDNSTGQLCRGRIDWLVEDETQPVLVGLKTGRTSEPGQFGRDAFRLGYHLQWAFYLEGYTTLTGKRPRVVEIVVESAPPHEVAVFELNEEILVLGYDAFQDLLWKFVACEAADEWPPACRDEVVLEFPRWATSEDEDLSTIGLEFGNEP